MRIHRHYTVRGLIGAATVTLGVLAGISSAQAVSLSIVLDWAWRPHHAPFVLAMEKGYYKAAGLDVRIEQGRGSASSAVLVGEKEFDLANLNVTNAAQAIGKGVPIKVVSIYQHRTAASFIGIKDRVKLEEPEDLKSLKIGSTPGGSDQLGLTIFSKVTGIPKDELNIVSLEGNTKTAALLTGQVDVVSGDSYAYLALVREAGQEPVVLPLADIGVPLLGFGFAANEQALKEKPEAIRKFLEVTKKAYVEATQDYKAACQLMMDAVDYIGSMEGCINYFSNLVELSDKPGAGDWGHQSAEEWEKLVGTLKEIGEIKSDKPASAYYTTAVEP